MNNEKVNILYVEENQDGTTGGSHYCLLDLVRVIDNGKFNPTVMFYQPNHITDQFKAAGARVIIYHKPLGKNFSKMLAGTVLESVTRNIIFTTVQKVYNIFTTNIVPFLYFTIFILWNRIHIVHMNNSIFGGLEWVFATKVTGRKIIGHQRGYYHEIPPYCGVHSHMYDYILGMSLSTRDNLKSLGIDLSNYTTFYDRIDADEFRKRMKRRPEDIRKEFNLTDKQVVIGIVGNLQRWKGQLTVVDAVQLLSKKYPQLVCLLIGDASKTTEDDVIYYKELQDRIQGFGLKNRIIVTGYRKDVPDILNMLDVFIHASTHPEPYGLVVLEAMVMGKAIVASNEGGPAEMIIDGESGFLVAPSNPQALAERLDTLVGDVELRKRMGANALKRMEEKFSSIDSAFIENLYHKLLKG